MSNNACDGTMEEMFGLTKSSLLGPHGSRVRVSLIVYCFSKKKKSLEHAF